MKTLFAMSAAIILLTSASQARTAELKPSDLLTEHNIYEAVLRSRLHANPLPANAGCSVYIANGHIAGLAVRLKELRAIVRAGAPDSKPPSDRWYWFRLGQVSPNRAYVMVRDAQHGLRALGLAKRGNNWRVVSDAPFTVTQTPATTRSRSLTIGSAG
jgi:hypothetical protein